MKSKVLAFLIPTLLAAGAAAMLPNFIIKTATN